MGGGGGEGIDLVNSVNFVEIGDGQRLVDLTWNDPLWNRRYPKRRRQRIKCTL